MKKIIAIFCLILICFNLGGCKKSVENERLISEKQQNSAIENEQNREKEKPEKIEVEGLLIRDEDDLKIIADGRQYELATDDHLFDYVDEKIKIIGEYDSDDKLRVRDLFVWKEGRLFYSVGNLYLTQSDGEHLLLLGSVTDELIEKYITRQAKILGKFSDKKKYKLKVWQYYIQNTTVDVYKLYKNDEHEFSIKYPINYSVNEKQNKIIFAADNENVILKTDKNIARPDLDEENVEKTILPSGLVVKIYHDKDKDGKNIDKLFFDLPDSDYDFYLAGFGPVYNQMYQTIELKNGLK